MRINQYVRYKDGAYWYEGKITKISFTGRIYIRVFKGNISDYYPVSTSLNDTEFKVYAKIISNHVPVSFKPKNKPYRIGKGVVGLNGGNA